jgi:hypothetical protein
MGQSGTGGPVEDISERGIVAAAKRYAAFDKSDPFALARALCHIERGIAGRAYHHEDTAFHKRGQLIDCFYDAEEHSTYSVGGVVKSRYTNMTRP